MYDFMQNKGYYLLTLLAYLLTRWAGNVTYCYEFAYVYVCTRHAASWVIKKSRLRRFGLNERKTDEDWVKRCTTLSVNGARQTTYPSKTWCQE